MNSPKKISSAVKNITAKEVIGLHSKVKFWISGYYVIAEG
jgi:hypothetical protein